MAAAASGLKQINKVEYAFNCEEYDLQSKVRKLSGIVNEYLGIDKFPEKQQTLLKIGKTFNDVLEKHKPQSECAICLNKLTSAVRLNCGHIFDQDCIKEWQKNSATCPLDRQPIVDIKVLDTAYISVFNASLFCCPGIDATSYDGTNSTVSPYIKIVDLGKRVQEMWHDTETVNQKWFVLC